jgi:hypothetical protein
MHELVGSDHSMTHVVVGSCQGETRTSEHIGIGPAEEGWTVANDNETYLVAALTYRKFDKPILVFLGKRGVTAAAVGSGTMVQEACESPLILPDVLYVPELDGPLFSVKAALRCGLSLHFWPSSRPGGADRIALIQNGRTVLTADPRGDLYYMHERSTLMAAARMATASALDLDVARDCHRSLGHVGFGTLADLCRAGMLRDDVTPAAFVQTRKESVCKPCALGKLRRGSLRQFCGE